MTMTAAITNMPLVHKQVHTDTKREQPDQDAITRKNVDAVFVCEQQARDGQESHQRYARTRLPETLWR